MTRATMTKRYREACTARLSAAYLQRLPQKLAELHQVLVQAQTTPVKVAYALELAHRLRGTAGAYGASEVSVLMGELEELLVFANASELGFTARVWLECLALVAAALASVETLCQATRSVS